MLESWVWTWPCKNYLTQNVTFIRHRAWLLNAPSTWQMHCHTCMLDHEKFVVWYQGQHISGQPASYAQAQSLQVQLKSFPAANCCEVHVRKLNLNSAVQKFTLHRMWHLFVIVHGFWMHQVHDKCIAILVCWITKSLLFGIRGSRFRASPLPTLRLSRCRYNWNLSLLPTVVKCMLESWIWTWPCKNYLTQNVTFIRHRAWLLNAPSTWQMRCHTCMLYHEKFVVWYQGQHISGQPASSAQAQSLQVQLKSFFAGANCCEVHVRKLSLNLAVQKLPYTECDIYSSSGMASECTKYMTDALPYLYITKSLLFGIRGSIFRASPLPPLSLSRSRYNGIFLCLEQVHVRKLNLNLQKLPYTECDIYSSSCMASECTKYMTNALPYLYAVSRKVCCLVSGAAAGQPASYAQAQSLQVQLKSFAAANCCEVHVRKLNLNSAVQKLPYTECDIYSSSGMASECTKYMTNALPYLYAVSRKVCCLVSGAAYFGPARFLRSGSVVAGTIEIFPCCQLLWSAC